MGLESLFHPLVSVRPKVSHLTSLNIAFPICNVGIKSQQYLTHSKGSTCGSSYHMNLKRSPLLRKAVGRWGGAASYLESVPEQLCDSEKAIVVQVSSSVTQASRQLFCFRQGCENQMGKCI